jgi:hypothetical protein
MNTNSGGRIEVAAAAVTGARHLRVARNGQDAALAWTDGALAALVVCDGCSGGASSEVGARLGGGLVLGALIARLTRGEAPLDGVAWADVRAEVAARLAALVVHLPGAREDAIRAHFLFTVVAAVVTPRQTAVWALGDGAYRLDDRVVALGPFADNAPPYLGYDLLDRAAPAHLELAPAAAVVMVATDGVLDLGAADGLGELDAAALVRHPDALRRHLAVRARGDEQLDWDARRVVRRPAPLQDDAAIAIARRGA